MLGLVTKTAVYHWSIEGETKPMKMFDRTANLENNRIINYRCDPTKKWLVLIGIVPSAPERPQLVKGNMQLFSVEQQRSQALEAHAAAFAQFKLPGNENPSTLIFFATKTLNARHIASKLHVIDLGPWPVWRLIMAGLATTLLLWPTIRKQLLSGGAFVPLDSALFWLTTLMLADNASKDYFKEVEANPKDTGLLEMWSRLSKSIISDEQLDIKTNT